LIGDHRNGDRPPDGIGRVHHGHPALGAGRNVNRVEADSAARDQAESPVSGEALPPELGGQQDEGVESLQVLGLDEILPFQEGVLDARIVRDGLEIGALSSERRASRPVS